MECIDRFWSFSVLTEQFTPGCRFIGIKVLQDHVQIKILKPKPVADLDIYQVKRRNFCPFVTIEIRAVTLREIVTFIIYKSIEQCCLQTFISKRCLNSDVKNCNVKIICNNTKNPTCFHVTSWCQYDIMSQWHYVIRMIRIPIIFALGQNHRRRSHSCPCRQQKKKKKKKLWWG